MKRVVKETKGSGEIIYTVEETGWFSDHYKMSYQDTEFGFFPAVFSTLEEAQRFAGITPASDKIIKREVIA